MFSIDPPLRVKHLNPRQGITTPAPPRAPSASPAPMCETPKSPPGDYNTKSIPHTSSALTATGVKHLNPRQGITTQMTPCFFSPCDGGRVKHLNPRQGITTWRCRPTCRRRRPPTCETPKSPPGDYNDERRRRRDLITVVTCETPKSPPGDYNSVERAPPFVILVDSCETPKSPPGDYNGCGKPAAFILFSSLPV